MITSPGPASTEPQQSSFREWRGSLDNRQAALLYEEEERALPLQLQECSVERTLRNGNTKKRDKDASFFHTATPIVLERVRDNTVLGFRLPLRKCRQNKLQLTLLPGLALLGCILTFPYFRDGNRNPSSVLLSSLLLSHNSFGPHISESFHP